MSEAAPPLAAVPRAAAVAGVAFALLFGAALLLVRLSIPGSIVERGGWLADPAGNLRLATDLLAWGGIAFLWFIGVVRTHIGVREDRFLASVYFGSGVLFLGMSFMAGAATQALLAAHAQYGERFFDSGTFAFGGRLAYEMTNTYSLRMAAVFMFSLATLCHRTGAMPRLFVWATRAPGRAAGARPDANAVGGVAVPVVGAGPQPVPAAAAAPGAGVTFVLRDVDRCAMP
ncbi:MAG: hypothetical protein J0M00_06555 [Burkholderiales bacterium]|nr:hypothetical protein [Burkholderiales bacterium]MBP6251721.1 hypothetical protein [Rubrivivax sp.]